MEERGPYISTERLRTQITLADCGTERSTLRRPWTDVHVTGIGKICFSGERALPRLPCLVYLNLI
jgi:hypothetical protein